MLRFLTYLSILLVAILLIASVALAQDFRSAMRVARERVTQKSTVLGSPYGDIEYSEGGSGADVLVIHGSGGGHDQGELIAEGMLGDQFHWIAPSRFGYLRSGINPGATLDDQAHAYAALLDQLGIERVAVVAMSHGGPSALLFAVLYPDRVSSLTLLSCGVASQASEEQSQANVAGKMLVGIYKKDYRYWLITKLFRQQFFELIGVSRAVSANLTEDKRAWIERAVDEMNPVSLRSAGVLFDNRVALPGARIAAIRAPTLVVHAKDDALQLYHNAEFAASTIPGARLFSFEQGGHFVLIIEQATVRAAVQQHILENVGEQRSASQ